MFHIIYETTCMVTGKYYRGMHSTHNLKDGYLGSGTVLRRSVKKYGKKAHSRKVLEILSSREALVLRESEIITTEMLSDPMCMNIGPGGIGHHPGYINTDESRGKNSKATKLQWVRLKAAGYVPPKQSAETIAKRVAKNTGKERSEEQLVNLRAGQATFRSTPESIIIQQHANEKNREKHAKTWIVETESGQRLEIRNLKSFCLEKELPMSRMYKTMLNSKFVGGHRVVGA